MQIILRQTTKILNLLRFGFDYVLGTISISY